MKIYEKPDLELIQFETEAVATNIGTSADETVPTIDGMD